MAKDPHKAPEGAADYDWCRACGQLLGESFSYHEGGGRWFHGAFRTNGSCPEPREPRKTD